MKMVMIRFLIGDNNCNSVHIFSSKLIHDFVALYLSQCIGIKFLIFMAVYVIKLILISIIWLIH